MSRGKRSGGDHNSYWVEMIKQIVNQINKSSILLINYFNINLKVFIFLIALISVPIGWSIFDISPLQPLEEIAFKQSEYRLKEKQDLLRSEMVNRHLKLGNSFLNVLQLDAAKIEFEEALKLDPLNLSAKRGLTKSEIFTPILMNDYDPEVMEKRLELILEENPNDPHAFLFLGMIYTPINQDKALEYYQKAIDNDPSIAAAYFGIGVIYDQQNKPDEALKMYRVALNFSKWNQVFLSNLGDQYYLRKEYQKAIEQYDLLLTLDDRLLPVYYTVSNSYRLKGNLEQARMDQEKLIRLLDNENVTCFMRNQQAWYFHSGHEHIFFYEYPEKKYYAYYNLAITYYLLGNETEALIYVKKAEDLNLDRDLEKQVKKLIHFDIDTLQEEQKSYRNRTEEFRSKFL